MAEERLFATLEEIAKENNYKDYHIEIKPVSSGGGNYTSILYHATITAPYYEKLNLFAKVSNVSDEMRSLVGEKSIFDTEFYFYSKLSKQFEALQEKHNVPDEHRLIVPKFYKGNTKLSEEVLVLENLSVKGFISYNRMKPITWEYAAAAVSQLAKFHALSFAYKQENSEEFAEIIKKFPLKTGSKDIASTFFGKMLHSVLDVLKEEYKGRVTAYFDANSIFDLYHDLFDTNDRNILTHFDYKQGNLLHRRKNGKLQVIPVDFQTLIAGSPVGDLFYFIFCGSDGQFRKNHYTNLIEYYYTELIAALRRLNVDIDDVYPRSDFQSDLKRMLSYGLVTSVTILPIVCMETEHAPDMDEDSKFQDMKIVPSDEFKRRINDAVEDFIKWGLI